MNHAPFIPVLSRRRRLLEFLAVVFMTAAVTLVQAKVAPARDRFAGHGNPGNLPWSFFSITDYLRILYPLHLVRMTLTATLSQ